MRDHSCRERNMKVFICDYHNRKELKIKEKEKNLLYLCKYDVSKTAIALYREREHLLRLSSGHCKILVNFFVAPCRYYLTMIEVELPTYTYILSEFNYISL